MTIRDVKLTGAPEQWREQLQQFVDSVVAEFRTLPGTEIPKTLIRNFRWNSDMEHLDVALGFKDPIRGVLVTRVQAISTEQMSGGCAVLWTWRSGYVRIFEISDIPLAEDVEVTMMVVL